MKLRGFTHPYCLLGSSWASETLFWVILRIFSSLAHHESKMSRRRRRGDASSILPHPTDNHETESQSIFCGHNKKIEIFRLVQIINGEIGEIKENPQRVVTHQGRAQRSDFLLPFSPFSFRFFCFLLFVSCILSFLLKLGGRTRAGLLLLHFFFANISPMEETLANFT